MSTHKHLSNVSGNQTAGHIYTIRISGFIYSRQQNGHGACPLQVTVCLRSTWFLPALQPSPFQSSQHSPWSPVASSLSPTPWMFLTCLLYTEARCIFYYFFKVDARYVLIFFLIFIYLFYYLFWLRWVLVAAWMRDLVPWPVFEPGPPAVGARSLTHWNAREVPLHWGKVHILKIQLCIS